MKRKWTLVILSIVMLLTWGRTDALSASIASAAPMSVQTGTIQFGVNLRREPSATGKIIRMINKGETITMINQNNSQYDRVKTSEGIAGYVIKSDKYIEWAAETSSERANKMTLVLKIANKYLGTPYEFGSDRNTTNTFDCSDFTRHLYKEALGIVLPVDSRQQGVWVKEHSKVITRISDLRPGDLVFFMSYKGSSEMAYQGIDKLHERITHVGMYIGNGQIIHTYSVSSGGVRKDILSGNWKLRFLYGGSIVNS